MPKQKMMHSPREFAHKNRGILSALIYGLFSMLISYCCISAVAGKGGLLAYQDMLSRRTTIQKAIDYLQEQNELKTRTVDELKNNASLTAERAAALGYIRPGETLIVLPESWRNIADSAKESMELPVVAGDSTGLPDALIRLMSAVTGIFAFLAILVFQIRPVEAPRKTIHLEEHAGLN